MSQVALSLASRLGELVGHGRVVRDGASLAAYEIDGLRPAAALQPTSVSEIAEILRFASAERLAVIPTGGRTHVHIGMPPHPYDIALDVSGMNRVLAFEPQDLTLGAEPGITFAELDRTLREKGQFLPLAPPLAERGTLGGIVAAGADTPFRYAHGTARDFLLGMEFVTGDGIVSKSGGRVVKNVTGYDLHKLFIGSLGTLGVITRLNLRTFPLPPDQRMFVAAFADASGALGLCRAITKSPLQPRILDVLDPGAANLFATRAAGFWSRDSWLVVIEAAGQEAVLERYARDLAAMSKEAQASEFVALDKGRRDQLFACLCEFSPLAFGATSSAMIFRVASLPSALPALLEGIRKLADTRGFKYAILIRALGVVYFAFLPPAGPKVFPELLSCSREMMDFCVTSGAAAMIERCPLEIKKTLDMWPPAWPEHEIAERLKHVFDPNSILSPGRFRGGI
jgi:glycolate dehydrogenase FAD-binding subunit